MLRKGRLAAAVSTHSLPFPNPRLSGSFVMVGPVRSDVRSRRRRSDLGGENDQINAEDLDIGADLVGDWAPPEILIKFKIRRQLIQNHNINGPERPP